MEGDAVVGGELQSKEEIISLQEILEAFSAPLNEEQAWAICFQCGKFLNDITDADRKVFIDGPNGILLSKDGSIRLTTVDQDGDQTTESEIRVLNSLGRTIYQALDYGLPEDEERELSRPLEELIEFMTASDIAHSDENANANNNVRGGVTELADSFSVDEGIDEEEDEEERDREEENGEKTTEEIDDHGSWILQQLLKLCSDHLPQPTAASTHYQAVCRAVFTEYLDLATFLDKITGSKEILRRLSEPNDACDGNIEDLEPRQWARIWLNVVRDLRNGVKLKKLSEEERRRAPIEYALTPYEMLMDDIRSHRYTLQKVMVDGGIPPRVKKEAHDIILDFIRSRPPLRPVPPDKLNQQPLRRESVHEKIMKEIRSQPELRPVPIKEISRPRLEPKRWPSFVSDDSLDDDSPQKRVLKAEFSLDWSEEESDCETSQNDSYRRPRRFADDMHGGWEARDLDETDYDGEDILERAIQKIIDDGSRLDQSSLLDISLPPALISTPEDTLTNSRSTVSSFDEIKSDEIPLEAPRRHSIGPCQSFKTSGKMYPSMDCLSLTVEEVIHIRSVLVKAEIENLRVNPKLHKEVLQDKVCFSCKKKFSIFKKKFKCRLCKKLICSVCCVKMFIPKEDFLHIPVESLSPSSPQKTPSTPTRQRSISEPPTPFLQLSPARERRRKELHVWRQPASPTENVCCECCTFLKNTKINPHPSQAIRGIPIPFSLARPQLPST